MLSFPITGVKKKKKSSAKAKTNPSAKKAKKVRVKRAKPLTAGTKWAASCSNAGRVLKTSRSATAGSMLARCKTKGKK